jgi:hypothetical protein
MPQTVQTAWGSFGDRHCGHATVATAVAFHWARRERVLLRDIFLLGTATVLPPHSLICLSAAQRGST